MIKKHILLFGIILIGIISVLFYLTKERKRPVVVLRPEVKEIEIYTDPVSFPSLLQMVAVVKSDPDIPKFIFWERRRNVPKNHPVLKNATILINENGLYYREIAYNERIKYLKKLREHISQFVRQYPNAKITLHLNMHHNAFVWAIFGAIPPERIKHIYWYEESFAAMVFEPNEFKDFLTFKNFNYLLSAKNIVPSFAGINLAFTVMELYPSSVYIAHPEQSIKTNTENFTHVSKYAQIKAIDFSEIARSLTDAQKKSLLELAGLSEEHIAYFKQGKPVMLDVLGMDVDPTHKMALDAVQLADLERVFEGKFGEIGPVENYVWLAKEHPWVSINDELKKTILKKYPFFHFLPKEFPLEALFLAGYVPDKMFGYSSSVFFAVPSERVLFYIPRGQDPYVPWLLKFGNIKKEQIYVGDDF